MHPSEGRVPGLLDGLDVLREAEQQGLHLPPRDPPFFCSQARPTLGNRPPKSGRSAPNARPLALAEKQQKNLRDALEAFRDGFTP